MDRGARAEGLAHLERAVPLAPDEAEAIYDLGTMLLHEQNSGERPKRFRRRCAIKPDSAEAHNNLGIALAHKGRSRTPWGISRARWR